MDLLLIALLMLWIVGLLSLVEGGNTYEWMTDHGNQRLLRKCFGQEGIHISINTRDREVYVSFSKKGDSYSRNITFTKAYALYREDPKGHGLRNKLMVMFKKPLN